MHTFVPVMLMVRAIYLSEVQTGTETHSEKANHDCSVCDVLVLLIINFQVFFGLCIKMRLGPMYILNMSKSALPFFFSRN